MILPFNKLTIYRFAEVHEDISYLMSWFPEHYLSAIADRHYSIGDIGPSGPDTIHWWSAHCILNSASDGFYIDNQRVLKAWIEGRYNHLEPGFSPTTTTMMFAHIAKYLDACLDYIRFYANIVRVMENSKRWELGHVHFLQRYFDYPALDDPDTPEETSMENVRANYEALLGRLGCNHEEYLKYRHRGGRR